MVDSHSPPGASYRVHRRVAGYNNYRWDGLTDLLCRARGCSLFDVGANRGLAGYDWAINGGSRVDGCDIFEPGVMTAREVFADLRECESRFEVVDLTQGPKALKVFSPQTYDATICLATYHKLKRTMPKDELSDLFRYFGRWTKGYFGWRGTSEKHDENDAEMTALDIDLGAEGLSRIHTSYISAELGVAAIWARG
jgi:hypothetical protein